MKKAPRIVKHSKGGKLPGESRKFKPRKYGVLEISYQLIEELLGLKGRLSIRSIISQDSFDLTEDIVGLLVEGDELPELPEAAKAPRLRMTMKYIDPQPKHEIVSIEVER